MGGILFWEGGVDSGGGRRCLKWGEFCECRMWMFKGGLYSEREG